MDTRLLRPSYLALYTDFLAFLVFRASNVAFEEIVNPSLTARVGVKDQEMAYDQGSAG